MQWDFKQKIKRKGEELDKTERDTKEWVGTKSKDYIKEEKEKRMGKWS